MDFDVHRHRHYALHHYPHLTVVAHALSNVGLEALVGYLYMSGYHERLNTIMATLDLL